MFLLDGSGGVDDAQDLFQQRKEFIIQVINGLDIGQLAHRVGLIYFAGAATSHFFLNDEYDKDKIIAKVQETPFTAGEMDLYDALHVLLGKQFIYEHGDRNGIDDLVFVLSDASTRDPYDFLKNRIDYCHQQNITLVPMVTSIGTSGDEEDFTEYMSSGNPPVENRNYFQDINDQTLDIVSTKK